LVNGTLINTVNASSNETENKTANNNTTVYKPNMTVEKLSLNATVYVTDNVYFMIVVTNTGDCELADIVVTEIYNSNELAFVDYNDKALWSMSGDVFTYNGVLGAGESANFTICFNALVNGTLVNTVNASSNGTDNKTANNTTVVKQEICDLEISKLVNASNVYVNDFVEWTIVVVNNGPRAAKDVVVNDTLPKGIKIISSSIAYEQIGDDLIWKLGDLKPKDPVSIKLVTQVLAEGKLDNFVNVNTTTNESRYDNNKANNTTFVNPICDLTISKAVNATHVYVNDSVEWTITVINVGPSTADDVKVKDTLPQGVEILTYDTHSVGSFDEKTRIWEIGKLDVNKPVSLVLVTKIVTEGIKTNIVNVTTNTTESDKTNNVANNTTVADPVCDLIINKTVNASSVFTGESVEWTINVVNVGPSTAENVKVLDTLPEGVEIVSYNTHSAGSFDKETRIWEIGKLDVNKPVSLVLVTKILTDGNITNIVSVNTTTYEPNKSNNVANNTTVANPICDLEIVKLVNSSIVYLNDSVSWTILVVNHGPSVARDVVVRDVLPNGLKLIDTKASVGAYSDGIWNIGDLAVNASETLELITQTQILGNITNMVCVNTTTPETEESNNKANNTTEVLPVCDLEITKLVNASSVTINDNVMWVIIVTNNGPCIARDAVVSDNLPNGLKLINATPSTGSFADGIWTIGDMEVGATESLTLITQAVKEGKIVNVAVANTTTHESDKSNNKANNTTVVNPICDLEIIKEVSSKKVFVGEELYWTIRVTNHGPSAAVNVKVLEDLPDSLRFVKSSATKGTYNKKTNIWTIGKLNSGSSETLVITTEVLRVGNITNPVEVTSTTPDSNKSNNKANNTTEAIAIVDLEVIKNADRYIYHVGDKICWTIIVRNNGPCDAHEVVATDKLPSAVKFSYYKASKGHYDVESGEWYIGDLAKGENVTLELFCVALKVGIITNEVNVTCNETDSNPDNNYDNSTVKVINKTTPVPPEPPKPDVPVRMLETGNPIAYLLVALMLMLGSFWIPNRKE
jgi:uncharacterized repeat protein (TIGR01451 family)